MARRSRSWQAAGVSDERQRCDWAGSQPAMLDYHDHEWGVPLHDEHRLFEMLVLEGAQAGLSWITILRKREAYRTAFAGFDPRKVARFDRRKIERLLQNEGIVRNRLKIESAVGNAKIFLQIQHEFDGFAPFVWDFVGGRPRVNAWSRRDEVPAKTAESEAMSRELKRRGMRFVGSTICYAFMQATGMVDDHLVDCWRYTGASGSRRRSASR